MEPNLSLSTKALNDFLNPDTKRLIQNIFNALISHAHATSVSKGFWSEYEKTLGVLGHDASLIPKYDTDTKLAKLALVMSELGEVVEGVRKPGPDHHLPGWSAEGVELADVVIRILDYCAMWNIPLGAVILDKLLYNQSRPYKHGKEA